MILQIPINISKRWGRVSSNGFNLIGKCQKDSNWRTTKTLKKTITRM